MDDTHDIPAAPAVSRQPRPAYKRSSYISSPETQQRIVRQFMLMLALGVALGLANAYVIASYAQIEVRFLPGVSPAETTIAFIYMGSLGMASLGIVLLLAVFSSHRIGGPVFKIVDSLRRLADGDLRARVRLRETDLLGDVAQAVNEVGIGLGRRVRELDEAVAALRKCPGLPAEAGHKLDEVETALASLGVTGSAAAGTREVGSGNATLELQRPRS